MLHLIHQALGKTLSKVTDTHEEAAFVDEHLVSASLKCMIDRQLATGLAALITADAMHSFPLSSGITTIGRDKHCRIKIEDPVISRQHAHITVSGGRVLLTDLMSTNGTYVNDRRVTCDTVLHGGDRVRIGRTEFVVAA